MTQAKSNHVPDTVSVQSDKGSLRLQFSTQYNPIFGGKRKYQALAMKDTPDNWAKAVGIAWRIEEDLQHADWQLLFDPTFAKYGLKTKYAAELKLAAPIPEPEPEMTVGTMWEDYLIWKQPELEPTTFKVLYCGTYTNVLKGLVWDRKTAKFTDTKNGVWDMSLHNTACECIMTQPLHYRSKTNVLAALKEAFTRLQSLGKTKLTVNPFVIVGGVTENKTDKYKSTVNADGTIRPWYEVQDIETNPKEKDRRAFTKEERDIIVKAFYESGKASERQAAPLIEFLFLTGCRSGEAFALTWNNVKFDNNQIVIHKSYAGSIKEVKNTKNGDSRLFVMYPKLRDLLLRIKPVDAKPTDLVFHNTLGNSYTTDNIGMIWKGGKLTSDGEKHKYPGVVMRLVESGAVSCYLSPYHTRHTFITLQARSGVDLVMLAGICSTGVDKIMKHYLEHDKSAQPSNI